MHKTRSWRFEDISEGSNAGRLCEGVVGAFGRQVHSSGIGGLRSRLRTSLEAPIIVGRFEPTTQECFACGKGHELSLSERVIGCECGWESDRDVNAALVILRKGLGLSLIRP